MRKSFWIAGFYLIALALFVVVAAGITIRLTHPLPSLEGRSAPPPLPGISATRLGRAIQPEAARHPGTSGVHAIPDPHEAFAARVMLARAAERTLDIQYYIWRADRSGSLLFQAVLEAADRGVQVRLLLDDNNTSGMDGLLAALDRHPNIEVRLFNPFALRSPRLIGYLTDFDRLNRRMHNKSFTADGQATIIGGRNVGDEYLGAADGALFLDLDVLAVGPVATDVAHDFNRYWTSASAYPVDRLLPKADAETGADPSLMLSAAKDPGAAEFIEAIRRTRLVQSLVEGNLPLAWVPVRMLSDDPAKGLGVAVPETLVAHKLRELLEEPRHTLGLVSGYFVPTAAGVAAFSDMAGEGVKVSILTNALEATDVAIVHAGYAKRRKPLLEAGIALYETKASALGDEGASLRLSSQVSGGSSSVLRGSGSVLHAKTFTVDDRRVFIGSFNFDPRSVHLNTEMGFLIESPTLARTIHDGLVDEAPLRAYAVRLDADGDLYWLEQVDGKTIRHDTEPGTNAVQRFVIWLLSHLPIEWML